MIRLILISLLFINLFSTSFGQSFKDKALNTISKEAGAIPHDYSFEDTLAIVLDKKLKTYSKTIIKTVKKNFQGKYVFIDKKEIWKSRLTYKWIFHFDSKISYVEYKDPGGSPGNHSAVVYRYYIEDVILRKKYQQEIGYFQYAPLVKKYMQELEKLRIESLNK